MLLHTPVTLAQCTAAAETAMLGGQKPGKEALHLSKGQQKPAKKRRSPAALSKARRHHGEEMGARTLENKNNPEL